VTDVEAAGSELASHDALAGSVIRTGAYPNGELSPYFSISSGTQVGSKNRP
jgi:hypothetical protein